MYGKCQASLSAGLPAAQHSVARHRPCNASTSERSAADTRLQDVSDAEFAQLLPVRQPQADPVFGKPRARSASDANALRRKGRLKEQDQLIDFILAMHQTHTCAECMAKVESWIQVRAVLKQGAGLLHDGLYTGARA